jgi:hypothetical protein
MTTSPTEQFTNESQLRIWWRCMTGIAALFAVFSVVYLWYVKPLQSAPMALAIVISWLIGPPFWFLLENTYLIQRQDLTTKPERMARFKLGQDSAKMFWFGIAALVLHLARRP